MKLYQFAAIWNPNEEQKKNGERSKLIIEPKTIIAPDDKSAALIAGRDIPEAFLNQLEQVDLAIRPF